MYCTRQHGVLGCFFFSFFLQPWGGGAKSSLLESVVLFDVFKYDKAQHAYIIYLYSPTPSYGFAKKCDAQPLCCRQVEKVLMCTQGLRKTLGNNRDVVWMGNTVGVMRSSISLHLVMYSLSKGCID